MPKPSLLSRGREGTPAGSPSGGAQVRLDVSVLPGGVVAGKYRIDAVNGLGGIGIRCEAFHLDLRTKVEVQIARAEYADHERAVARILSEAREAAQLRSQHARRVLDCGRLDVGAPYMVVEHLEGADLRRVRAAHKRLPVGESLSFVLQACEALGEAHSRGIVHGDLKPENLFLTHGPDGSALIKVLDLGVSTHPTAVDARTDVQSLGVILQELVNGEIPESLAAIVVRCMDKDPSARFPDATALGRALRTFGGLAASVARDRVDEILRRALSSRPEGETSQSVADAPASVVDMPASVVDMPPSVEEVPAFVSDQRDSAIDMPASVIDLPDSDAPPPLPDAQRPQQIAPPPSPNAARSVPATSHSVRSGRPSQATKPPPLPPSHSPPSPVLGASLSALAPTLTRLVWQHRTRLAIAAGILGSLVGFFATQKSGPASEPSSASPATKAAPMVEAARHVAEPAASAVDPHVIDLDEVPLPSAAPVAAPTPPPRAPAPAKEFASESAHVAASKEKTASSTKPASAPSSSPRKRSWLFPDLKEPVLPPNVH